MPGAVATESHAVLGVAALAGNTKGKRPKTRRTGGSVCDRSRVTSCGRNFVSTCVEILLVGLDADIGIIGRLQIENIPSSLVLWDFTRAYLTQRQLL